MKVSWPVKWSCMSPPCANGRGSSRIGKGFLPTSYSGSAEPRVGIKSVPLLPKRATLPEAPLSRGVARSDGVCRLKRATVDPKLLRHGAREEQAEQTQN